MLGLARLPETPTPLKRAGWAPCSLLFSQSLSFNKQAGPPFFFFFLMIFVVDVSGLGYCAFLE